MKNFFVTGIGTDVGKTVAAAVLTHYHQADYWKPIQTGDVKDYTTLETLGFGAIHPSTYDLKLPASPHLAAEQEKVTVNFADFKLPQTQNNLILEGAGGILVPLNDTEVVGQFHQLADKTYLIISHYLGSINHSLLSIEWLKREKVNFEVIISGEPNLSSESIIEKHSGIKITKFVPHLDPLNLTQIQKIAQQWTDNK